MAESVVRFAVEKLATLLIAEAESLGSLSKDVRDLSFELGSIKAVLKNAEKKAEEDDTINEWLMQVRDVAYNIEDVIDEYLLLKQQQQQPQQLLRFLKWLGKAVVCASQLKPRHELTSKIKEIKTDIEAVSRRRDRYQFITTTEDTQHGSYDHLKESRVLPLLMDKSEVVDIEDRKNSLIQLMNLGLQDRLMIAVVGMGGIGKTTIVRQVYNQVVQNNFFKNHAWVTVSQSYKPRDLLITISKEVHCQLSEQPDASDIELISTLKNHLKSESYIIVFDDVWDIELLKWVDVTLPSNDKSSRILMTTRDKNIAQEWKTSLGGGDVHNLEPLPAKDAWDLFVRKIFGRERCPQDLEEPARDMVAKCKGLPLAIVAVAGLLSTKKKVISEWNKLRNSIGTELGGNRRFDTDKKVLLLSYHELPYHLKPCFLYFGLFPEDYSIKGKKLVRLWIAEGFIQDQQGKTLEEVGEDYLDELVNRSLVEVDKFRVYKSSIRDTSYKVHDILWEMIIVPKSENLGFCLHLTNESNFSSIKRFRRFGIDWNFENKSFFRDLNISSTRSLLLLSYMDAFSERHLNPLLRVVRLLKVLDLDSAEIEDASKELGNLQHLQYLSLRGTNIKVLPKSIGKLCNLQTLDLKNTQIVELPKELAYCCKLRHLLAYPEDSTFEKRKTDAVKIPGEVLEKFKELQTLVCVKADEASIVDGLGYLRHLRTLQIAKLRKEHGKQLCYAIEKMKDLRSLSVGSVSKDEILDIQHITTPTPLLERLYLDGVLEKLPDWIAQLNSLTSLRLFSSRLQEDPLTTLQGLPNLMELRLDNAFIGEKLDFGCTSFSKLVSLVLKDMDNLKFIVGGQLLPAKFTDGIVFNCPNLVNYPDSFYEIVKDGVRKEIVTKIRTQAQVERAARIFEEAAEKSNRKYKFISLINKICVSNDK